MLLNLRTVWHLLLSVEPPRDRRKENREFQYVFETGILCLRFGSVLVVAILWNASPFFGTNLVWARIGWSMLIGYLLLNVLAYRRKTCTEVRQPHTSLGAAQVGTDLVFASAMLATNLHVGSFAVVLYMPCLMIAARVYTRLYWSALTLIAMLLAATAMFSYSVFFSPNTRDIHLSTDSEYLNLAVFIIPRVILLGAASTLLRLYRISEVLEQNNAVKQQQIAEQNFRNSQALQQGTRCGITILGLDGRLEYMNETFEKLVATRETVDRAKRNEPCYWVFHGQRQPCRWCGLQWKRGRFAQTADGDGPEQYAINTADLKRKIEDGKNWAISVQLRAGDDTEDRLHIYHIYYGILEKEGEVTGIVESVTEITDSVLEMPFLLRDQHDRENIPLGLPAIGVVSADDDRRVLGMNSAKFERCKTAWRNAGRVAPNSKEELIGLRCFEAYGRQEGTHCYDCPVTRAIRDRKPVKSLAGHPGQAMVTAVPVLDPQKKDEGVIAVFEFIDDISELKDVEDAARRLNGLQTEEEVIAAGLSAFKQLGRADRCALLEFRDSYRKIVLRGDETAKGKMRKVFNAAEVPLTEMILRTKSPIYIEDISRYEGLGNDIEVRVRGYRVKDGTVRPPMGPALIVPMVSDDGNVLGVASLERELGGTAFDQGILPYCMLLAGHFAGALARARELEIRRLFIETIQHTADILSAEVSIPELVKGAARMLPDEVSLSAYLVQPPPDDEGLEMVFCGGAGIQFEIDSREHPDKWRLRKGVQFPTTILQAILHARTIECMSADDPEIVNFDMPILPTTRFLRILPLVYGAEKVLGFLIAESSLGGLEAAFSHPTCLSLQLVVDYGGVLLGRTELLNECILYLHEHDLRPLLLAAGARAKNLERILAKSGIDSTEISRITRVIDGAEVALRASLKTWKIAAGNTDVLQYESGVHPREIVERAIALYCLHHSRREFVQSSLEIEIAEEMPRLCCDAQCITACVQELLSNAFRYRKGDTRVVVAARVENDRIRFSVANEAELGKGIPPSLVGRLFEPFFRLPHHSDRKGSGLGLWRAALLTRAHTSGEIGVTSFGDPIVQVDIWLPFQQA